MPKSRRVGGYLESLNGEVGVEFLPAYAPELNPAEYIWGRLKQREPANLGVTSFVALPPIARNRLCAMQRRPELIAALCKQAKLPL